MSGWEKTERIYMSKDEVAAPTIMLESIFITGAIKAKEGKDVAVIDLPGAFFHATNEDDVIMRMTEVGRTHGHGSPTDIPQVHRYKPEGRAHVVHEGAKSHVRK